MTTKIIDRIAKLLNLAEGKGTTPAEAATAAAQASRLMLKHGIDRATVEGHGVDLEPEEEIDREVLWEGGRVVGWVLDLADGLARLHCCRVLIRSAQRSGFGGENDPARITVVGTPSNAAIVRYLLTYLMREIDRLAKETDREAAYDAGVSVKSYRNAFRKGAAAEVIRRMRWERNEHRVEIQTSGQTVALARVDSHDQAVQKWVEDNSRGTYGGGGSVGSRAGLAAGREAGRKISVHSAMGGGKSNSKLLGG